MLVPTGLVMKPRREPQYPGAAGGSGSSSASGGRKTLSRAAANETDHPARAMRRQLQPSQSPRSPSLAVPHVLELAAGRDGQEMVPEASGEICRGDEEAMETRVQQGREADG